MGTDDTEDANLAFLESWISWSTMSLLSPGSRRVERSDTEDGMCCAVDPVWGTAQGGRKYCIHSSFLIIDKKNIRSSDSLRGK